MKQGNESAIVRYFQRLSNLFYLMVGIPLLAFGWVYLNLEKLEPLAFFEHPVYRWFWHIPVMLLIVGLSVWAALFYRKRLNSFFAAEKNSGAPASLEEKVKIFYESSLPKYLLLTAAVLLAVFSFYLSTLELYAAMYGILLLAFTLLRPSPERIGRAMHLSAAEVKILAEELKPLR